MNSASIPYSSILMTDGYPDTFTNFRHEVVHVQM